MSVYKVIEIVGTSENSWEEAAKNAVEKASQSLEDLRVAEVTSQDLKIENGEVVAYRIRVSVSFKFKDSNAMGPVIRAPEHPDQWAQRLKRVFNIDIETCSECGGAVKVIAGIENPVVIKKILTHLKQKNSPSRIGPVATMPGPAANGLIEETRHSNTRLH